MELEKKKRKKQKRNTIQQRYQTQSSNQLTSSNELVLSARSVIQREMNSMNRLKGCSISRNPKVSPAIRHRLMVAASGERQTSERTRVFPRLWVSRRARARFQATTEQERASKRERERERGRERARTRRQKGRARLGAIINDAATLRSPGSSLGFTPLTFVAA